MLIHKRKFCSQFIFLSLLINFDTQANYAPKIINPNDGYKITLKSDSVISQTPTIASNGKQYYKVGNDITISKDSPSAPVFGYVKCAGRIWGASGFQGFDQNSGYHRVFIYAPSAGLSINNLPAYKINSNMIMTVHSNILSWTNVAGTPTCANLSDPESKVETYWLYTLFPLTFSFYINERIIDGQVIIEPMALAGYVRAFMKPLTRPEFESWPFNETSAPVHLEASQLNVASSCTTTTSTGQVGTVNLRHGQLNTLKYDSKVTEKVNYTCKFSTLTKVRLRLDYAQDGDPQKRLPLVNKVTKEKIYTTLMMTDDTTGQSGLDMNVDIQNLKTISISSHLQGTNAPAGDYQGSAWLIATFL